MSPLYKYLLPSPGEVLASSGEGKGEQRINMKQRGFSLLEVLLAMALVSFLLAGTGELVLRSIQCKKKADGRLSMTGLLSSRLEIMKALPFESADFAAGSYSAETDGETQEVAARAEWQIEDISPNIKKIKYRIFIEGKQNRAVQAFLLVSRHLGF
jgi:prepilin-type N-terminal cleavage/methylation domain-containing protein